MQETTAKSLAVLWLLFPLGAVVTKAIEYLNSPDLDWGHRQTLPGAPQGAVAGGDPEPGDGDGDGDDVAEFSPPAGKQLNCHKATQPSPDLDAFETHQLISNAILCGIERY